VFSRLASIPTSTLVGVAAFGGTATALFGLHTRKSIQTEWARKPFYQDAIKALRIHPGAKYLLGEPIIDQAFDLGDATHNFEGESTIRLRLPVLGPAGRGHYSLVAEKAEANIVLVRSDLEVEETKSLLPEQFEGKKMIIYARERHGDIKSYVEGGGSVNDQPSA